MQEVIVKIICLPNGKLSYTYILNKFTSLACSPKGQIIKRWEERGFKPSFFLQKSLT